MRSESYYFSFFCIFFFLPVVLPYSSTVCLLRHRGDLLIPPNEDFPCLLHTCLSSIRDYALVFHLSFVLEELGRWKLIDVLVILVESGEKNM